MHVEHVKNTQKHDFMEVGLKWLLFWGLFVSVISKNQPYDLQACNNTLDQRTVTNQTKQTSIFLPPTDFKPLKGQGIRKLLKN